MRRNDWYSSQGGGSRHGQSSPDTHSRRAAANSVQDAHSLLGVYPLGSVTPTTHVARHLSNLSLSAGPPSYYVQPQSYSVQPLPYTQSYQTYLPPISGYSNEIQHLASPSMPTDDGGYWESTRDEAVRYLGESSTSYSYYQQPVHYSQQSTYETHPFAQSVFHHSTPSAAYPTPPPPGISTSSSSLANALSDPPPKPKKKTFKPEESQAFFDNFIAQKTEEILATQSVEITVPVTPRRRQPPPKVEESPDPLALGRAFPQTPTTKHVSRKRKDAPRLESPSIKRIHASGSTSSTSYEAPAANGKPSTTDSRGSTPRKLMAYVEIPVRSKGYMTPTSHKRDCADSRPVNGKSSGAMSDDDDLGGFGPVQHRLSSQVSTSIHSSGRRATGERDDRAPLEKLTALLEDIFEAEDSLPPEVELDDLPLETFSPLTVDRSRPLLNPAIIRKLTSYVTKVSRPSRRQRYSSRDGNIGAGTPRSKARVSQMDVAALSRILRMLNRSVSAGEDVEPFGSAPTRSDVPPTPSKSKKSGKNAKAEDGRSKSKTPRPSDEDTGGSQAANTQEQPMQVDLTETDLENLSRYLDIARDSVLAADCCIALLVSDRLTKQLYSEELITSCLRTVKNQLTRVVYPFVEASSDVYGHAPLILRHIVQPSSRNSSHRRQLAEIFQALSAVIPRINDLIYAQTMAMSEGIIIQAVYIAIGPFFVVENGDEGKGKRENAVLSTLGNSAMRGLRLDALSLIRNIFASHEDQRGWIIEEILSSLIKLSDTKQSVGQFRLRDGRSIRTVSALLLQLVQTSAHDIRLEAKTLYKARQQLLAMRRQESIDQRNEPFLDEKDMEEIRLYMSGLDSATKAAKTIIIFLTQRSGKSKTTKNTNEAEYRAIFDNLISDLLVVLFWPEWPAASLLLSIACKFMVSSLDDIKTTSQNDNNAAKTMALDHLGVIAARLRSSMLKYKDQRENITGLRPLDEMVLATDVKSLNKLTSAHEALAAHLCKRSSEDQAFESARELTAVAWGQELAATLQQCGNMLVDSGEDEFDPKVDRTKLMSFGLKAKEALRDVWAEPNSDVFDTGSSQEEVARFDRLSEEIGTIQSFKNSFNPILNIILQALDAPPVFMRTKALKALGQIVTSDPSVLSAPNVRRAIESHLLDSSPAVRDAAVELIGKYMIDSPKFAADYYGRIADRIADTGLGVRKRVIKLLKSIYTTTEDHARRVDICTRIVLRMVDEDDTVKDLAVKTVEELWFQSGAVSSSQRAKTSDAPHEKTPLLLKVSVIMGVSSHFRDRHSPLEDMLHQIISDKDGAEAAVLHSRYAEICETLIDGLVDASDLPGFTVVNCVRTIHLFTSAYPAVLSGSNAATLLPYLKNATSAEEQSTSDYLLRIFRASITHMPKTAAKFGQELQLALQPMIIKPSTAAGVMGLQETVACMCATVHHLTHDFGRLVALLRSCNARLQQAIARPVSQAATPAEQRALVILLFIVSLLCEHCDFDALRTRDAALGADINTITKDSVIVHVYRSLLHLHAKYDDAGLRGRILQCLGFLFRAQPALMTAEPSANIMDTVFASPEEEAHGRLLKILQDFLVSEAAKHSAKEKANAKAKITAEKVNMEELVGNTDGFADSGVSSAVVQRYLNPILQAALSSNGQIQAVAVDILTFTIKQGLAHPLQSFPVIIALETSPIASLSSRVSALHSILHTKHASLLNARYVISARTSFDYQKKLAPGQILGYRMLPGPTALLQKWYSLVREKRATRQDFLKALIKVFDVELTSVSSQDDVDFIKYMTENFATFDYKTQEEVLTVLKYLTAVLSTTGMQLIEALSPSHLLAQLHAPMNGPIQMPTENGQAPPSSPLQLTPSPPETRLPLMRTSVIVAMIMLLKAHLKALYGLSEEKCSKWVVGKKSALGDKPATRRHERPISWERLPFATAPLLTSQDCDAQRTRFLEIWSEDGLTAEPEDDMA
ncbi:hypothetical protein OBBRIDRAFT_791042 [Obba rivulosa]|uniref:Sister chromatid cohesion protein n=1 Tax=Obba rivulosa TaxID=1052685 RepID=A0A8E2DMC4_9APHY|nr:hypothetical protein OBBRIDRAFT_791042 [Obba rivulosa]